MQLQVSFLTLLAGIFVVLSSTHSSVDALPLSRRETPGVVTLPLKRVALPRNIHPQILLQQHINRSRRRLARMTGRSEPSFQELENNLKKRVVAVEATGLEKRFSRYGVPKTRPKGAQSVKAVTKKVNNQKTANNQLLNQKNKGGKGQATKQGAKTTNDTDNDDTTAGVAGTNTKSIASGQGSAKNAGTSGKGATAKGAGNAGKAGKAAGKAGNTGTGTGATTGAGTTTVNELVDNVTNAGTPTGDDSLGLDIEANDIGYLATVQMGTPPRDFLLLMDSGSADLWVGAENCVSEDGGDCGNHNFLGPGSSSSFVDTQAPFTVTYGTGSVSGDIVTDKLAVAGLTLADHKFGVATTESVEFSDDATPFDGLMGLAQSTLSEQKTLTPIEALAQQGLVNAPVIGYKISRLADNKNDGEITFGGTDPAKFDPATVVDLDNVSQQGFWEANMDAVSVDGKDTGLQGRTAILDTGTTLIIAPAADAQAVHDAIPGAQADGQGGFTVPCNTQAQVALTFGGRSFAIDPRDIAFQPLDPADPNGDCVSGIAAGNIGGDTEWLVGDVFLKNAYFSTDVANNQMSLADLV